MSLSNGVLWAAVVVTAFIAVMGLSRPAGGVIERIVGASGSTFTELVELEGGVKHGNNVSTSTFASVTVTAAEMRQWIYSDVVVINPTGAASSKTITFPASTTLSSVIPSAGDMSETCFYNATTSVAAQIVFAGGTGTPVNVASSSAATLGSTVLLAGEVGCFKFVRGAAMPTAFDITANYTAFK
jgi:hypothetical protein